jgi:hypothetical protein
MSREIHVDANQFQNGDVEIIVSAVVYQDTFQNVEAAVDNTKDRMEAHKRGRTLGRVAYGLLGITGGATVVKSLIDGDPMGAMLGTSLSGAAVVLANEIEIEGRLRLTELHIELEKIQSLADRGNLDSRQKE